MQLPTCVWSTESETSQTAFLIVSPGRGENQGSFFWFSLIFSLYSSTEDHTGTAPPKIVNLFSLGPRLSCLPRRQPYRTCTRGGASPKQTLGPIVSDSLGFFVSIEVGPEEPEQLAALGHKDGDGDGHQHPALDEDAWVRLPV